MKTRSLNISKKLHQCAILVPLFVFPAQVFGQHAYTWQELRDKFFATNPTILAGQFNIDESKANEITAFLRPNPDFTFSTDGFQLAPYQGVWKPVAGMQFTSSFSYLHERQHKRELRLESAKKATDIAQSTQDDLKRNLAFNLRNAFVQALQAKAVLEVARENLAYYDRQMVISRDRFNAGDMAEVDLMRLELQRVQYASDLENAQINVRTSKIQLLQLLNDRTPLDQFDVTGPYEFSEVTLKLEEFENLAIDARPDLKAAIQSVSKAETDHNLAVANGSTDPTFSAWWSNNPSFNNPFAYNTLGLSINIPLRIFDKNQGEKARTQLDIGRNEKLRDAAKAQALSDVDSAYVSLVGSLNLLRPYRSTYLPGAAKVRETVSFSYQRGAASLLDYLDAQKAYRDIQLSYVNLIGSYLTAANQLNLAVGREVIQ